MVNLKIDELGNKFQDYRDPILGDSYNWGPVINANDIKYFTFHHSVTKQTAKVDGNWKAECDAIAKIHVNGNGWGGVGYRFIICSDGTVAYVGDLSHGGSAVEGENNITFSVCFVGDFTKEVPTAAQVHSAHLLAKFFLTQTPQYPNLNGWEDVLGHKEWANKPTPGANATACPGSAWKVVGDNLYSRIKEDHWQGYPDPQPVQAPAPTPTPSPVDPCAEVKKELENTKNLLESEKQINSTLMSDNASLGNTIKDLRLKLDQIKALVQ